MHLRHPSVASVTDEGGFDHQAPAIEIRPDGVIINGGNPGEQGLRRQVHENRGLPRYSQQQAAHAQSYLWSDRFINALDPELSSSDEFMKKPGLLLLLGQLPATPVRHVFQEFLAANWRMTEDWTSNPVDLVKAELFKSQFRDPGWLLTLKSLPRQQPTLPGQSIKLGRRGEIPGANQPDEDEVGPVELKSMNLWFEASAQMMLSLMNRMQLAAANQTLPASHSDELDVKLHRDAEPIYDARLELLREKGLGHTAAMPDLTTVNYVRMEMTQLDERTIEHYERAVRNENVFSILNNNGMWIESTKLDRMTGELVSTDILISRSRVRKSVVPKDVDSDAQRILSPGHPIVIEVLTVRIPDPDKYLQQSKVTQK
ncbi:MAG: hypothetical protein HUJ26_23315, partial [Planctomycetaceae bacterium]|nr:hypothetical protein [Planctomycetaceae bacterium]